MERSVAQPGPDRLVPAGTGHRSPGGVKRAAAVFLALCCAALLAGLQDSAGGEANATLGVSLIISAGCTVMTKPSGAPVENAAGQSDRKVTVSVTCTNDVPYQLGISHGADAASVGSLAPQITLAPGFAFDAVNLIVTY